MCDVNCTDREVYTVRVDSIDQTSADPFVTYLNVPLRNVVKVELVSGNLPFNSSQTPVLYIHVNELVSKNTDISFRNTAINVGGLVNEPLTTTRSNVSFLVESFARVNSEPVNSRTIFATNSFAPLEQCYIDPIRQVTRLSVRILDSLGAPLVTGSSESVFLEFKFYCAKNNICQY
jgi:hypothetical protein